MGRQIAIAMSRLDEREFLSYLQETEEVAILRSLAPTVDQLWVDRFDDQLSGNWHYDLWNKRFSWTPEYRSVGERAKDPSMMGWKYVSNKGVAPLIEFSRSDVENGKYGRIYWGKYFAAPNGLTYDVAAFDRWYEQIAKWIRKHGRKIKSGAENPYFFPDALMLIKRSN